MAGLRYRLPSCKTNVLILESKVQPEFGTKRLQHPNVQNPKLSAVGCSPGANCGTRVFNAQHSCQTYGFQSSKRPREQPFFPFEAVLLSPALRQGSVRSLCSPADSYHLLIVRDSGR